MDSGAWRAAVHGVAENWTWLSNWANTHTQACILLSKPDKKNATQETYGNMATVGICLVVQTGVRLNSTERDPNLDEQNKVI